MRSVLILFFSFSLLYAQDSLYTREIITYLTSKKCNGRGYVKHGVNKASVKIEKEIKRFGAKPLFNSSYIQPYTHPVNTFPKKVELHINGKKLIPGRDFIIDPESPAVKGSFNFIKKDSVTFLSQNSKQEITIKLSKKLTYSVGLKQRDHFKIELLRSLQSEDVQTAKILIQPKLILNYKTNNIGAYFEGVNNDSMVVFTAHYDHLGAMGKNCYFPGANDNASGTSMVLNLMKYYAVNKPKYKTVFIFFSSEEAGLIGSNYFVKNNSIDLAKIKFLVNLDLLGTGDDGIMVVNGAIYNDHFAKLEKINQEGQLLKTIKKRGKAQNSDHYWFTEKGVQCFFIYTLGGVSFYHDIDDKEKTLPLTKYKEVFKLLLEFASTL
ncbi:MAG: M28 family metallopeptidase [Sphingobacteriaceae bacterium]